MSHPNIIKFYEKFEDNTKNNTILYLVMELVEGGDLNNWLYYNKDLNSANSGYENDIVWFFLQMVEVVFYLTK